MDFDESDPVPFDVDGENEGSENVVYDTALAAEASREYVGQWNRLVSTTNWEKGRVIFQWRESMKESGAPAREYSDDAWSKAVGNVTSQHVGRLRRVYERFEDIRDNYTGLFWSHFQAVLDWEDAETWLDGASDQHWSVAQMRKQRWIALGAPPDLKPKEADIFVEMDEDVAVGLDSAALSGENGRVVFPLDSRMSEFEAEGVVSNSARGLRENPEKPHADSDRKEKTAAADVETMLGDTAGKSPAEIEKGMKESVLPTRLFSDLPPLPSDLEEAMEMFKLAILNHKLANWSQIPKEDVQLVLDMLKQLCE
ncbi:MAG: hypothetical protein Q4D98_09580 [Planctomycetia bacterium]|nr:hypothetical protein [Planctomycetia bacterium]